MVCESLHIFTGCGNFDSWNCTAATGAYPCSKYSWRTCLVLSVTLSWRKFSGLCSGWLWIFLKVATHGWDEVNGSFRRVVLVSSFITTFSAAGQLKKTNMCALIAIVFHFITKFVSCLCFASLSSFVLAALSNVFTRIHFPAFSYLVFVFRAFPRCLCWLKWQMYFLWNTQRLTSGNVLLTSLKRCSHAFHSLSLFTGSLAIRLVPVVATTVPGSSARDILNVAILADCWLV